MGNPETGHKNPKKLKVLKTIDFKDFLENKTLKTVVFQFGPQKLQKLKPIKTIDFKVFLQNISLRKLPQISGFRFGPTNKKFQVDMPMGFVFFNFFILINV